ncbi:MAG: site-specific DNA-methyltransferase [Candidatus Omnitrophica bacterium]|nr:site-specific DNA-methyltransferase [Candidatus Omnitrophota bacterium]
MKEMDNCNGVLFKTRETVDKSINLVVKDDDGKQKYQVDEIRDRVILGDAFKVLKKIDDAVFDMVFIDPPYFLQLPNKKLRRWSVKTVVEGVNEAWDKFSSFLEYDKFIQMLLTEVKRVMKPAATIWVIATYHSIFRIGKIMQDLGYWILNDLVWVKTNPMPNWLGVRFTNATEHLIWAVKDKKSKKYTFNKEYAKAFGIGKVGANVWVLPICWGDERLKDSNGKKLHSTQKPVELLKRVILTSTKKGDLVLDPVAGSGTTGWVAHTLERNFVMIEINPKYVKGIEERFKQPFKMTDSPYPSKTLIDKYMNLKEF